MHAHAKLRMCRRATTEEVCGSRGRSTDPEPQPAPIAGGSKLCAKKAFTECLAFVCHLFVAHIIDLCQHAALLSVCIITLWQLQ